MKDHLQRILIDRFGIRVVFVDSIREPRSRDSLRGSGSLPAIPDAVAHPTHPDEVVFLARFSAEYRIPLVPRGAATSGYGGTLPIRGGIVVDFTHMNRVLHVDTDDKIVAVEPGITWKALDWALRDAGLTLRVYPSSGALSTVGGWVASGGVGIGSYEYGPIGRNVAWVEIVLPDGQRVRLSGENLPLVLGAQGITGLIVGVGLPVRQLERESVLVATWRRLSSFLQTTVDVRQRQLPVWHVSLITAAVDADEEGTTGPLSSGEAMELPRNRHTAIFAFPAVRRPDVAVELNSIILTNNGVIKPEGLATDFWNQRWGQSGLGSLGPSTATGSVMLPVIWLERVFQEARARQLPVRLVGKLSAGGWIALSCLPAGGRTLPDEAVKQWLQLARDHSARPYGLDVLETDQVQQYLDPDLHIWLTFFKRRQDPDLLMNPGKLLSLGGHPAWQEAATTLDRFMKAMRSDQEAR